MAEKKKTSVSAAIGKKKKDVVLPSKQTMNFVHHQSSVNPVRLGIVILIILVAAACFTKFGILDQEQKKLQAYNELSDRQTQLAAINAKLSGYDELAAQYGRYSYGWMDEKETSLVGRMDVIQLLEQKVMPSAAVQNFSLNDNVLTMNISGVTLERASLIVKQLESSEIVESAAVYSADAEEAAEASIFMSVILAKEDAANEE